MTDSNAARAAILDKIKNALAGEPPCELPQPTPVFAPEVEPDRAELAQMFAHELAALKGETIFVQGAAFMPRALGVLMTQRGLTMAAVQNSSRVSAALANLAGDRFFQASGASKERIATASCGIIEADALLSDTGSVVALFKNRGERLLPYLPPTCIVIADVQQLRPHMDDGITTLYSAAAEGACGEGVIITGPSRSADIEKVLVLGAHGPSALIVMLSGISEAGVITEA